MKTHFAWAAFALVVVVGVHLVHGVEPPPKDSPQGQQDQAEKPNARYAQAKLKLAEWNLARMEAQNQRVANSVSGQEMLRLKTTAEAARTRLDLAMNDDKHFDFENWLLVAETEWRFTDQLLKSYIAIKVRTPNAVQGVQIDRLRLHAAIWKANLERGRALIDRPQEEQLAWRISVLIDVFEL
jgi:hypothetical protein